MGKRVSAGPGSDLTLGSHETTPSTCNRPRGVPGPVDGTRTLGWWLQGESQVGPQPGTLYVLLGHQFGKGVLQASQLVSRGGVVCPVLVTPSRLLSWVGSRVQEVVGRARFGFTVYSPLSGSSPLRDSEVVLPVLSQIQRE